MRTPVAAPDHISRPLIRSASARIGFGTGRVLLIPAAILSAPHTPTTTIANRPMPMKTRIDSADSPPGPVLFLPWAITRQLPFGRPLG